MPKTIHLPPDDLFDVHDMGPRKVKARTFYALGLADAMRTAADYVTEQGQFGVWDVTTEHDADTGYWYVNIYMAMFVEQEREQGR